MSFNLGPLVLTVIQFVSAAVGFLVVVTLVPEGIGDRRAVVVLGIAVAALLGSAIHYRVVRPRMPDAALGEDGEDDPVPVPPELRERYPERFDADERGTDGGPGEATGDAADDGDRPAETGEAGSK